MPMHIMHTAATTRPYLSRRQKPTCPHVARSVSQVGFGNGRTPDEHDDQQNIPQNQSWPSRTVLCARFQLRTNTRTAKSTSRGNRKTRAVGPCRALSSTTDQRTDGPVGRSNSTKNPLNESQRHEKSADWGSSAMHCVIYISTTRPEFGRPTLAERSVYSKCVGPNNGLIVSLPRPP